MRSEATNVDDYMESLPEERKPAMIKLREIFLKSLPEGFSETMGYGMMGYVVPHTIYPNGYHCDPKQPLPFVGMASQKNFISLYHMGLYADENLMKWFVEEYPKHSKRKLDMGKSCIRFKKPEDIPFELIDQLLQKMTVQEWIDLYEKNYMKSK